MQGRAEQNQGWQSGFSERTRKQNNHTEHRRSLVAINKAPNTHNEILLGAEENASGANVTRGIHQQRSWKNRCSSESEKPREVEAKATHRGLAYWIKHLS